MNLNINYPLKYEWKTVCSLNNNQHKLSQSSWNKK